MNYCNNPKATWRFFNEVSEELWGPRERRTAYAWVLAALSAFPMTILEVVSLCVHILYAHAM